MECCWLHFCCNLCSGFCLTFLDIRSVTSAGRPEVNLNLRPKVLMRQPYGITYDSVRHLLYWTDDEHGHEMFGRVSLIMRTRIPCLWCLVLRLLFSRFLTLWNSQDLGSRTDEDYFLKTLFPGGPTTRRTRDPIPRWVNHMDHDTDNKWLYWTDPEHGHEILGRFFLIMTIPIEWLIYRSVWIFEVFCCVQENDTLYCFP